MSTSPVKNLLICLALAFSLAGCVDIDAEGNSGAGTSGVSGGTGSGSGGSGGSGTTLRGSVGDGPIVNASIVILDSDGAQVASTSSDSNANYEVTIPAGTAYPLTIVTTGGLDTVTNSPPTFSMSSIALSDNADVANITPFSTFIVENAKTLPGGLTESNIAQATGNVVSQLNFGLDASLVPNPITSPVTNQNVAVIVKASEALGELIRRVQTRLQNAGNSMSQDDIIIGLSADLADGVIDGQGAGADSRVAATATVVSAQVLVETLGNNLQVNGASAVAAMDNSITLVQPSATTNTAAVLINAEVITQTQLAIAAAQSIAPSQTLTDTAAALSSLAANSTSANANASIPDSAGSALNAAETSVASASSQELNNVNATIRNNSGGNTTPAPTIAFSSSADNVAYNGSTTLNWSATNAESCTAAGAWSGDKSPSGSETVGPLTSDASFSLNCSGSGGQATVNISVDVGAPSTPTPTVSISASPSSVSFNGTTVLSWSSSNADSCTASGAWSGGKSTGGSQTISSLTSSSSFTITCSSNGGSTNQTVNVSVAAPPAPVVSLSASSTNVSNNGSTTLNWSSSNASSCSASGDWSGNKAVSGSQTISSLTSNKTFTLVCSGIGGSTSRSVNVSVDAAAPTVSLSASNTSVAHNGSTTLSWSSSNASACSATGDWSGGKTTSGSQTINSLISNSSFTITCSGTGGSANDSVNVSVSSAPAPTLSLSASNTSVPNNGSTTLSWSSANADSCSASGDWSGGKSSSGSQTISSITSDSTFTLTCTGEGGSINRSVNVTVTISNDGTALLSWTPPTTNSDGSALTDLAGYKIYYGTSSGSYSQVVTISDPGLSSHQVNGLSSGTWYFAVSAFDNSGNEGARSNESSKTIN